MTNYIRFKSVDEAQCFLGQSIYIIRGGEYQEFTLDSVNLRTGILEINGVNYHYDGVWVLADVNTYTKIVTKFNVFLIGRKIILNSFKVIDLPDINGQSFKVKFNLKNRNE